MVQHDAVGIGVVAGGDPAVDQVLPALERAIADRIGPHRFQMWFQGRTRFVLNDTHLTVGVPNLHFQMWIQKNFAGAIREAAVELLGAPVEIELRIDPALFRGLRAEQQQAAAQVAAPTTTEPPKPPPRQRELFESIEQRLVSPAIPARRRWRHLGQFVVGPSNRVGFAAAMSAVEEPGQGPNPLVLHGPVGTGKTHLLEGIYAGIRRRRPDLRVLFISSEDFTNRFVTSVRFGRQSAFRKFFRTCDVLLLDDLHFLAKKRATQEEFLHTFDSLLADGAQVVLSSDCHPRLNDEFMPELMDRLLGGAIWGLLPPDAATRLELLRAKSCDERIAIPEDVLKHLAEHLRGNVRELEGALHGLRHYSRVANRPIDLDLAREALGDLLRHAVRVVRLKDVDAAVCSVLRLPAGALQGKERTWTVSHPRMLAIYLCRKHTAGSYSEISKHFSGKSHSNAVAAEKKVRHWLANNERVAAGGREWPAVELIERIERELQR